MPPSKQVGRYLVYDAIASGGMATVHLGKLMSQIHVGRIVAIKCLHHTYSSDPEFVTMLIDEATLSLRLKHPNIVPTLDVLKQDGELFLVMEYIHGESLKALRIEASRREQTIPPPVAARMLVGALDGLHYAHEARSPKGDPLHIVHRDVSPQNMLAGADGACRVLDFGIAKAAGASQNTAEGHVKGKFSYMAPEQLRGVHLDRRVDIFAAGAVLWEMLTGKVLFAGAGMAEILGQVLTRDVDRPSSLVGSVPQELDEVVLRALSRNPDDRYPTALAMAEAIEKAIRVATDRVVASCVKDLAGENLATRAAQIEAIESETVIFGLKSAPPAASDQPQEPMLATHVDSGSSPVERTRHLGAFDAGVREVLRQVTAEGKDAAEPAETPSRRRLILPLMAVAAVLAVGAVASLVLTFGLSTDAASPAASGSSAVASEGLAPTHSVSSLSSASSSPAHVESSTAPPPVSFPVSTPRSTLPPQRTRKPTAPSLSPPTSTKPSPGAPSPAKERCNPPWRIDERGVRVPKPECI